MKYVGSVPYDTGVTAAMVAQKSLVDFSDGKGAKAIKAVWKEVTDFMGSDFKRRGN